MEYSRFRQLIKDGEKANVDFKITCEAFASPKLAPRAELAKDICAMANNGNVASYIIVGVSDDGKSFKSVSNTKLTEEKVQDFCKKAIFPPARIRVHRKRWMKAQGKQAGKCFVIIKVGPHARQAFRLHQDFVTYDEKLCYRRNQVWVRRGPTSDLATPEEIARLVKGRPPEEETGPETNVEYDRLPGGERRGALRSDVQDCIEDIGGSMHQDRVVVAVRGVKYVWRCFLVGGWVGEWEIWHRFATQWRYEHGALFFAMDGVSNNAFGPSHVHFKRKWGWFTEAPSLGSFGSALSAVLPVNAPSFPLVILTLPNLRDTRGLRRSLLDLFQFLERDEDASTRLRVARDALNSNLRRWLKGRSWAQFPGVRRLARSVLDLSAGKPR